MNIVLDEGLLKEAFKYSKAKTKKDLAEIYFKCRKRGYQVGSTIDCLIA